MLGGPTTRLVRRRGVSGVTRTILGAAIPARPGPAADTGGMVPDGVSGRIQGYLATLEQLAPAEVAAVYGVGALALNDFSARQSNIDLVVVAGHRPDEAELARLAAAARGLRHAGRPPQVWYVTWEDLDRHGPGSTPDGALTPAGPNPGSPLATPMTRAILRHDPMALFGPDWPVVGFDVDTYRAWAVARLKALVASAHGTLILRRDVVPLVLEAARLTEAAITGRVLSKSEAGELVMPLVSTRHQRLLTDAVGYRHGARFSMYWGPFERKYDALTLLRDLEDVATSARP